MKKWTYQTKYYGQTPKVDMRALENKMVWMGFRESTKGTPMLRDAIKMYFPGIMLTKELYPELAQKYNTTASCVERALRFAIEAAAMRGDGTTWGSIFGHNCFKAVDAPSVGEFISRMQRYFAIED